MKRRTLGLLGMMALLGCDTGTGLVLDDGEVVARNGAVAVTRVELEAELTSMMGKPKKVTARTKARIARRLIRRRALAAEARRRGLDQQPRLKRKMEQLLVAELERVVRQEAASAITVTEDQIIARYKENQARFTRPRMVSASCVLASSEREARQQKSRLRAALRDYQPDGQPQRLVGKGTPLRRYGYFGETSLAVPRPVLKLALAAEEAPSLHGPVRLKQDSWCVVLVDAIRPRTTMGLDAVEKRLRLQLEHEARRKAEEALLSAAYDDSATEIDESAL